MTDNTPAPIGADARSSFIRWYAGFLLSDEMHAAHVWDNNHIPAQAWRAALASAAQPAGVDADRAMRAQAAPAAVAGPSLYQVMAVAKAIHATTPDADDWDSLRQWEVDALRRRAEKVLAALVAAPTTQAAPQPAVQKDELFGWVNSSEIDSAKRMGGSINLWLNKYDCDTPLYTRHAAPVAQGDALPREDFAWMVVQEACETEPADEDDPECIRILRLDLKSAVLSAFLREDAARAQAKEGGA